jgi:nicotinamide riboside kinase
MRKRIAITGPECTGKSTLASQLAEKYDAHIVHEYAREYLNDLNRPYNLKDIEIIAQKQFELNNQEKGKLVIADTEMIVTKIWYEEKFKEQSNIINNLLDKQNFDFYFLCKPDIPWQYDELRENPTDRDRIFMIYKQIIEKHYPNNHSIIKGNNTERIKKATQIISDLV